MRETGNGQWWLLITVAMLVVFVWPPSGDRSLAIKAVNWAVDPWGRLPIRPGPLAISEGDDLEAIAAHDLQLREYDALYAKGGWTRTRLELKVARDPLNAATERQLLTGVAVVVAFLAWRRGGTGRPPRKDRPE